MSPCDYHIPGALEGRELITLKCVRHQDFLLIFRYIITDFMFKKGSQLITHKDILFVRHMHLCKLN